MKKPIDADYTALSEDIKPSFQAHTFKVGDRVRIIK